MKGLIKGLIKGFVLLLVFFAVNVSGLANAESIEFDHGVGYASPITPSSNVWGVDDLRATNMSEESVWSDAYYMCVGQTGFFSRADYILTSWYDHLDGDFQRSFSGNNRAGLGVLAPNTERLSRLDIRCPSGTNELAIHIYIQDTTVAGAYDKGVWRIKMFSFLRNGERAESDVISIDIQ